MANCTSQTVWSAGVPLQPHVEIHCTGPAGHKEKDGSLHRAKVADSVPLATVTWDDPPEKK